MPPASPARFDGAAAAAFIRTRLPLCEVPGSGGVRLHLAGPSSGLSRLVPAGAAPYWAHPWPGGVALAAHLAAHPDEARVALAVDLGSGSGLVGIAAARAALNLRVLACDPDPLAGIAARLNAEANGVGLRVRPVAGIATGDAGEPPGPRLVLAGDVFYDAAVAARVAAALDRQPPGTRILVGDVGRRFLPRDRLRPLASYSVRDVGDPPDAPLRDGWVHQWAPMQRGARRGRP